MTARLYISYKFRYLNEVINMIKEMMKIPRGYYGYWKGLEKTELEPKLVFPDGLLGGQGISVILFLYLIVVKQNKTTQDKIITSQVQCGYFIGWRHHDEKQTFRIQSSGSVQLNG